MDLISAFFLGLIQGLTEWLPISSSAHLVFAQNLFNFTTSAEFDIVIMLGTTSALILYFSKRIFFVLDGILHFKKESLSFIALVIVAGFFTALIGFPFRNIAKSFFYSPVLVCIFLFFNGLLIYLSSKKQNQNKKFDFFKAALVGFAQGCALIPGISRSGSTISTALLLGINRIEAAEFSFLLGVPSMFFASIFEFIQSSNALPSLDILFAGFIGAFITGYISIDFFFNILKKGKWVYFSYYCIFVSLIFLFYFLFF
ncbi:MAG: undecaprenyl-diphosphate phosphatase [Candidatus Anstonellaceae archaeon]